MSNGSTITPNKKLTRRAPSAENQRQIEEAIAARSRKSAAYGSNLSRNCEHQSNQQDEPGVAPVGAQYEYLNHPADVLLHSWGKDFESALQNLALAMFGCITSLSSLTINKSQSDENGRNIVARGHDSRSLVYAFLDEWLFNFHDTGFVPKGIYFTNYDAATYAITCNGEGEILDLTRHPRGVEVKAITYSAMRVETKDGRCDIYTVVDI